MPLGVLVNRPAPDIPVRPDVPARSDRSEGESARVILLYAIDKLFAIPIAKLTRVERDENAENASRGVRQLKAIAHARAGIHSTARAASTCTARRLASSCAVRRPRGVSA